MIDPTKIEEIWLLRIAESLAGLQFGTVEIKVHEGRVVQIERIERVRLSVVDTFQDDQEHEKQLSSNSRREYFHRK